MTIEARARSLRKVVEAYFNDWKTDPEAFAKANPTVVIACEVGARTEVGAMRSIAAWLMDGTGFDYEIAETFGGPPMFFVGQYDERNHGP